MLYGLKDSSHNSIFYSSYSGSLLNDPAAWSRAYNEDRGLALQSQAPGGIPAGARVGGSQITRGPTSAQRESLKTIGSRMTVVGPHGPRSVWRPSGQATARIGIGQRRLTPISPLSTGLAGFFDDLGKVVKRATTPPRKVREWERRAIGGAITKSIRVATSTAVGAGAGFLTGGPYGAVAGGAYGFGKGIYGEVTGAPTFRTQYQTILPAAGAGFIAGKAAGAAAAKAAAAKAPAYGGPSGIPTASPAFGGYASSAAPMVSTASGPVASFTRFASAPVTGSTVLTTAAGLLKGAAGIAAKTAGKAGEMFGTAWLLRQGSGPGAAPPADATTPGYLPEAGPAPIVTDGAARAGADFIASRVFGPPAPPVVALPPEAGAAPVPQPQGSGSGGGGRGEAAELAPQLASVNPLTALALAGAGLWLLGRSR